MAWEFNTETLTAVLEEAAFDVAETDDILSGIKEENGINHQIYINSKGHVRYQFAKLSGAASQAVILAGKNFTYDKEVRDVVNIIGYLDGIDMLVKFLRDISLIIRKGR